MKTEEWRSIDNGRYSVSNLGRVRRDAPGKGARVGRVLKRYSGHQEYWEVNLGYAHHYVHRLVAEAFLGACPPGKEVNHMDGDKRNAAAENLEYVTRAENAKHAFRLGLTRVPGLKGERNPNAKLTDSAVRDIRARYAPGSVTLKHLASEYDVSPDLIGLVVKRKTWRHIA
jgi:hypothetical protein